MHGQRGFTLAELIAVMLIVGILSVFVFTAFDRESFEVAGYTATLKSQAAYAQKLAVATRRTVAVTVNPGGLTLNVCTDAAPGCGAQIPAALPGGAAGAQPANSNLTLGGANFSFFADGTASATTVLTINGNNAVTIFGTTGYVQ